MSYISALRKNDEVLVWERVNGVRELKTFPAPYYFYVNDPNGPYTSMYGDKLSRYDFDTAREFYDAKKQLQSARVTMWESDIASELRVLSEHYYNKPAPVLNVTFFDIEVDYSAEIGFSSVANPYAPINSVAIYHKWLNKMVLIAIPPEEYKGSHDPEEVKIALNKIAPIVDGVETVIIFVKTEKELLMMLMREFEDSDVICGWNSDWFDVPYVGKRLEKYGKRAFSLLSFPEAPLPKWREVVRNYRTDMTLDTFGRIRVDYLELFRKYEQEGRPSYKLESIADEFLPTLPKLKYEGSLAKLYRRDFLYFIRYNLRDTEILKGFEEKLGYVQVANVSAHLSTAQFTHVTGTIKLSELSVINECHHELGGLIVNDMTPPEIDRQIQGALVLYPQTGEHTYTGSIDIKSLYPSAIISLNISPETLRGQFVEEIDAYNQIAKRTNKILTLTLEDGTTEENTANEWRTILWDRKWAVSGYGTCFDQSKPGIIPTILKKWFDMRIQYQKLMKEAAANKNEDMIMYYDKLQYVYKIKLNSFYGALSNLYFRFYDLRMGESTTGSGRAILKHQCRTVAKNLEGNYDVEFPLYYKMGKDEIEDGVDPNTTLLGPVFNGKFMTKAVLYGDTDSTYFNTFAESKEEAIIVANAVSKAVNDSYQPFMRDTFLCQPGFDNRIKCSREIVTDKGIFVNKKRYILHLIDLDGKPVDKMKVMGLETKKTTLPKWIATKLTSFIERYLKGEPWTVIEHEVVAFKDVILKTENIMDIGLPKGINGVEEYMMNYKADQNTKLPGGQAAAILYNLCLEQFGDKQSPPLLSGMKMKVFHLQAKVGRFKTIAIPTDIEEVPTWFLENFPIQRKAHVERLIDNPLSNIIECTGRIVPTKQKLMFDSMLGD